MTSVHTEQHCSYTMTKSLSVLEMLQETNTSTSLEQSLYLRPKKIIVVSGNMDKK